jgi:hypothetical protein
MRRTPLRWAALVLGGLTTVSLVASDPPSRLPTSGELWGDPADLGNTGLAKARTGLDQAKHEAATSATQRALDDAQRRGLDSAIKQASSAFDLATKALAMYQTLSQNDKGLDPNYRPPGAPDIPSQCMEDPKCKVCFGEAQAKVDQARIGLEKARAIYEFTNKLAKQGEALMQGAASMAGGPAAVAASVETMKTEETLKQFNQTVKAKNKELLGKVEVGLRAISACEKQFYKNDDWYNRYGYMYMQFMLAHYGY